MTAPDAVPPHPRIVTTPTSLRRNEVVIRGVTASRLTVDHARSFEVPCRWVGAGGPCDAVVTVSLLHGEWFVSASPDGWGALLLHNSEASAWGRWGALRKADRATFPTPQEALDAAFATEQIAPRGGQT